MKKNIISIFDVLIVYSARIAFSANSSDQIRSPFKKGSNNESYNEVYGYFLESCNKNNVRCAFTTSRDIVGPGKCKSYWIYENKVWIKSDSYGYSKLIFDKFSPVNDIVRNARKLLFSDLKIKSFNSNFLFELFFDKFKTYKKLIQFTIPAVSIKNHSVTSVVDDIKKLNTIENMHINNADFSDELVMKDRYGAGGKSVYKFNKSDLNGILKTLKKSKKEFIFQPLIRFNKGFKYNNVYSSTDIRFVYLSGKVFQTYIRIAKPGDFRCNEHRGGKLIYVSKKEIPKKITILSEKIAKILGNQKSLYSLDFIVSNNENIYLLEGNTGPGLDWEVSNKTNEFHAKKLIRTIAKQLALRTQKNIAVRKSKQINKYIPAKISTATLAATYL